MSISPRSGANGLQRLLCLKYYTVRKQESRFGLELDATENLYEKMLQIKVVKHRILYKKVKCVSRSAIRACFFGRWNLMFLPSRLNTSEAIYKSS